MSLLFRYVARLYLVNIATLTAILASFIVSIDVVINLDRFSKRAAQIAGEGDGLLGALEHVGLTLWLVIDLWGPRLLQLFAYLNGVVLVTAMGFTCTQLVRHAEFVAMLAGGVSLHRAGRAFLAVALMMIGCQAAVQEFAVPAVAHLLPRDPDDSGKPGVERFPVTLTPDAMGRLWRAREFDDQQGVMRGVWAWERDPQSQSLRAVRAESATWDGSGWTLEAGDSRDSLIAPGRSATAPTPVGRIDSSLDPAQIKVRHMQGFAQSLSLRDLDALRRAPGLDEQVRRRLERTYWGRYATWCSSFIALWGSLSLFLVRSPRPMIASAMRAAPIALAGFASGAAATGLSIPGLPGWFGAFVPCLVLLSLTVALATSVET